MRNAKRRRQRAVDAVGSAVEIGPDVPRHRLPEEIHIPHRHAAGDEQRRAGRQMLRKQPADLALERIVQRRQAAVDRPAGGPVGAHPVGGIGRRFARPGRQPGGEGFNGGVPAARAAMQCVVVAGVRRDDPRFGVDSLQP